MVPAHPGLSLEILVEGIGWRTDECVSDVFSTSEDVAADGAQPARFVAVGVVVVTSFLHS